MLSVNIIRFIPPPLQIIHILKAGGKGKTTILYKQKYYSQKSKLFLQKIKMNSLTPQ